LNRICAGTSNPIKSRQAIAGRLWREALETEGIDLSVWRIDRKIGMCGGLFTNMLLRETGLELDQRRIERLQRLHADAYSRVL
jgi:hypothetical protein